MKVVAVLGSPRSRASSSYLVERFLDVASANGAETSSFILNNLKFIGCQGCYGCKRRVDTCVIQDDLTSVLSAVAGCDVLVLGSPVYIHDVTGQLKCFIDRAFSYLTPDFEEPGAKPSRLAPGKKMFFIVTQGHPDANAFNDVPPRYEAFFRMLGFNTQHVIASGVGLQEQLGQSRPQLVEQVESIAREMTKAL